MDRNTWGSFLRRSTSRAVKMPATAFGCPTNSFWVADGRNKLMPEKLQLTCGKKSYFEVVMVNSFYDLRLDVTRRYRQL